MSLKIDWLLEAWLRGPNHPAKLRLFSWAVKRLRNSRVMLSLGESKLVVSINDFIGSKIIFDGLYERRTIKLATDIMRSGGMFVDVGSNIGLYAILLSELDRVEVIAIEPDEFNFEQLRSNVIMNNRPNVKICNMALSKSDDILPFELPCDYNYGSVRVASLEQALTADAGKIVYRAATSFDRLARWLNTQDINLMKIDVEGHELLVLEGIDWSAKYKPRNIICEFLDHGLEHGHTRSDVYNFLLSKGYEGLDVEGIPINQQSDTIEHNAWFRLRPG
jgi:FkbM family methyltransferase